MLQILARHPLARRHFLKAARRIVQWQIRSRLAPTSSHVVPFIGQTKLHLYLHEHAALANWYYGLGEFEMMSFLLHFLRPGDDFIDVGANIGSYSILASGVNRAYSIAIEPIPETFERLKQNVGLNQLDKLVKLYHLGLSDQVGALYFTNEKGQQNHVIGAEHPDTNSTSVEVSTLDIITAEHPPTLLKIDVEGYDTAVIAGGRQTLENPKLKAVILETMGLGHRYGFNEEALHQKMLEFGFQSFAYNPFERRLSSVVQFGSQTLYLREVNWVKDRVRTGSSFEVFGEII